jgi:predicted alpha/beta hydrolase family esterase
MTCSSPDHGEKVWRPRPHPSGNHETPGTWRQGSLEDDIVDLSTVVEYLKSKFGYVVHLLVGHSRGSIVAFHWLSTTEEGKHVAGFVNVSGRYRMHVSKGNWSFLCRLMLIPLPVRQKIYGSQLAFVLSTLITDLCNMISRYSRGQSLEIQLRCSWLSRVGGNSR